MAETLNLHASQPPLALITGTTHGIGRVTAHRLAEAGLHVVMLCRDTSSAAALREEIQIRVPGSQTDVLQCDLSHLGSVRACAEEVRRHYGPLDLLINNAGTISTRHRFSGDGFELTFATNHLGPFLLTELLLDRMAPECRIVNVASRIHYDGKLDLDTVTNRQARYRPTAAYAQSKLANVLHSFALARRLANTGITVNCLHPGVVASNLLPRWLQIIRPLLRRNILNNERGAQTTLHLALSDSLAHQSGLYFDEFQQPQTASALANDVELQERLWIASAQWVAPFAMQST